VAAVAESFETPSDMDEAILEAALTLAGQVDRDPGNAMLWARFQGALRELQMAVRASQESALVFEKMLAELDARALLIARDRVHYGEGFWTGGDRQERFRRHVEMALSELHFSWRDLFEAGHWAVYPIGDDRCQVVLGSLPLCEVDLADVGLDAGGRALESHNGRRRRE